LELNWTKVTVQKKAKPSDPVNQPGVSMVPEDMKLHDGQIFWGGIRLREQKTGTGMLSRFVELHRATDTEIFEYACKWGVLGICEHGLPSSHRSMPFGRQFGIEPCVPLPGRSQFEFCDPLDAWRHYSLKAWAMWSVGNSLNHERQGTKGDWSVLGIWPDDRVPWKGSIQDGRQELGRSLMDWIHFARIGPCFGWNADLDQWEITITTRTFPNLFGLLSEALMMAISDKDGYSVCCECRQWYLPARRVTDSKRNYCSKETCKKAAWRDSKRAARSKSRESSDV
jgi:hypothetical protein